MKLDWIKQSHNIVDIIHGVIPYNGLEAMIMENPIFARLQRVLQSSLVYLTYPSNKVHRFEHSIGVMHLSSNFFFHSIINSEAKIVTRLLDEIENEIKDHICNGTDGLLPKSGAISDFKNDSNSFLRPENVDYIDSNLYREYTPSALDKKDLFLYYATFEAIRLAGLLHDIGHLPYSHIMEFALKRLYREIKALDSPNPLQNDFVNIMKPYCESSDKKIDIHEAIGQKLVNKIFISINEELPNDQSKESIFLTSVFYMVERILKSKDEDNTIFRDLHRIMDGVIDCDRMDYCCRDLFCSGVSREFPRYERLFNTVQLLYYKDPHFDGDEDDNSSVMRERCIFAFTSKALGQIEMLLQRRWEDFTTLNYHHKVHKHELILELTIVELGKEYLASDNREEEKGRGILPFEVSSIWETIKTVGENGAVDNQISQLDDEWLNTLLRYNYIKSFGYEYSSRNSHHNERKWNLLDELITGQKHYCSLFKRSGGFRRFDDQFRSVFKEKCNSAPEEKFNEYYFDTVLKWANIKCKSSNADIYQWISDKIGKWSHSAEAKDYHIIDCILDENDISTGIKASDMESIHIISSRPEREHTVLTGRSNIYDYLEKNKTLFPKFHLYYLPDYNTSHSEYEDVDYNRFQKKMAEIIADAIIERIGAC